MKILTMMWNNLRRGYQTLLFPMRPAVTQRFRGQVQFDPNLCIGCAICRFRCTAKAIEFKAGKEEFTWSYNAGQCTFCGRCIEGCKEDAIKQEEACPPVYLKQGDLKRTYIVPRRKPPSKNPVGKSDVPSPTGLPGGKP
jgi:formate hydrogenlyase subunit 6